MEIFYKLLLHIHTLIVYSVTSNSGNKNLKASKWVGWNKSGGWKIFQTYYSGREDYSVLKSEFLTFEFITCKFANDLSCTSTINLKQHKKQPIQSVEKGILWKYSH